LRKAQISLGLLLICGSLSLAFTSQVVFAMPSAPGQKIITQPDGSQFGAQIWGDERFSGFETLEGYSIERQKNGWWTFMLPSQSKNNPSCQGYLRVGLDAPPAVELQFDRKNKNKILQSMETPGEAGGAPSLQSGFDYLSSNTEPSAATTISTQPVLVVLGYYDDMPPRTTPADFHSKFFGSSKSVRDYYAQASYGRLSLAPAIESSGTYNDGIIGWVNLGKTHPSPSNQNWDATLTIIPLALKAADPYINFASYDMDGNQALSASELHIVLIIAGYEASYDGGAAEPCVWGHKWSLSTPVVADGTTLASYQMKGSYTMFGEIMGDHISTIGVMVHEMGHDLGWPDLYGTGSAGLGTWDIMSFGGWNTAAGDSYLGQTPPLPNAYLRKTLGWIDPNNPAQLLPALEYQNTPIDLSVSTNSPFALILPVDPDPSPQVGDFFMVENRAKIGYDASLPGAGALVWHVNEAASSNNNPLNLRVKLIQTDGADHLLSSANYGDPGDAFNAGSINTRFGLGTPLSSAFANGEPSNILIVFGLSGKLGLASIISSPSMGVMVSQAAPQVVDPANADYFIYLPLAQR
jgi:M6 family metalloprotease-like protein